jgi:hypothetical protein
MLRSNVDKHPTVLDMRFVSLDATRRVSEGLARFDLEFPAMPWAAEDFAFARPDHLKILGELDCSGHPSLAYVSPGMRTIVVQSEDATVDHEKTDAESTEWEKAHSAFLDLLDATNALARHLSPHYGVERTGLRHFGG